MSTDDPTTFGPVDLAVIAFEGNNFKGEIIPAIRELVDGGIVRIIDAAFVLKDSDGSVVWAEVADTGAASDFSGLDADRTELMSEDDLQAIADALDPDTSAAVLVWENVWARRAVEAFRNAGGQVVAFERIPAADVIAAYEYQES